MPVLIGGHGATRTPRLAARYADEFNMPFASIEDSERQFGRVRAAAEEAGPQGATTWCTPTPWSSASARTTRRWPAGPPRSAGRSTELKANGLAGSPAEVVDKIGRYAAIGASRIYLQILDLDDLDHLELISSQVQSQLRPTAELRPGRPVRRPYPAS